MAGSTAADVGLRLVAPCEAFAASYVEALREGYRRGVQPATAPDAIDRIEADFLGWLTRSMIPPRAIGTPDGSTFEPVPSAEFWAVAGHVFVGSISIRFTLNALLERYGGHAGYGVRPSLQGRGHATRMAELAKDMLRKRGDTEMLISCSPDNLASRRVIEKIGGVLLREDPGPFGHGPTLMFRVPLA
jgi:predicted acetyltransferase